MTIRKVALPYGREIVEVEIDDRNLIGISSPRDVAAATSLS